MRIDVHAHHLPEDYLATLREGNGPAFGRPHDGETLRAMIDAQDSAGIDRQVICTGPNSPYLADPALAVAAARGVNDRYREISDDFGGRFAAFAALPLPHPAAAIEEAIRALDELGLAGVYMGCSALGKSIDDPAFEELWSELDRRDAIVYIHPGGVALRSEPGLAGMDDMVIAVTIGSAAEIATAALRLTRLCRRRRRVRPIIALLGGALPFLLPRVAMLVGGWPTPSFLDGLGGPDELLSELRRFYYEVNLLPDPEAIRSAVRAFGFDRLLFGSDSPSGSPRKALDFMAEAGLTAEETGQILAVHPAALFRDKPTLQGAAPSRLQ